MIRTLLVLAAIGLAALGLGWLANHPGDLTFTWLGYRIETSVFVGLAALVALAIVLSIIWTLARLVFRLPSLMSIAARARRRNRGFNALSRGMMAVGAGDVKGARRHAGEAAKWMKDEPLTLLLKAQTAQLTGDRAGAERTFNDMLARPETRLLGLRGLYVEAMRRSDEEAANHYAGEAQKIAPLGWSGQALLEDRTRRGDWTAALATLDSLASGGHLDRQTARRHRAVLKTALAQEKADREPEAALALAREAVKLAPALAPAAALAARLLARKGDLRKAARLIETAWTEVQHPELAEVYVNLRHGDSALDRLARAKTLYRLASGKTESRLVLARAAMDAQQFGEARAALAPLLDARPQVGVCLAMAELEEKSGGAPGKVREWLGRASRAPRDPCWIADGVMADVWSPVSPVTGQLDAFVWRTPDERLTHRPDLTLDLPPETDRDIPAAPLPAPAAPSPSALAAPLAPAAAVAAASTPAPGKSAPAETQTQPAAPLQPPAVAAKADEEAEAETEETVAPPARRTSPPGPVIFPLANAPDDPGPMPEASKERGLFS